MRKEFLERVEKTDTCWNWTMKLNETGYGQVTIFGKCEPAHRVSYEMFVGDIPENYDIRHKCDNRRCVNPEHLEVGTRQQNINDKVERNRQAKGKALAEAQSKNRAKGEAHGTAKLTEVDVVEMRLLYDFGESKQNLLTKYGISTSQLNSILARRLWKHV